MKLLLRRLLLSLSLAGLSATGCQNLGSISTPTSKPVTLKLSGWGASPVEKRLLQNVLKEFERSHPDIRVKFEVIADQYMDVLKTRLIGDAASDVFYLDALEAPFLMQANVLEPLNAYITREFDLADFEPNLLNVFRVGNTLYGLPKDYSTLALVYNKQAFQAAGLAAPPQTWEAFMADAKQLTLDQNRDGKPEQHGWGLSPDLARLVYVIQAYGGCVVDQHGYATFAQPKALMGLQMVVNQYRQQRTAILPSDVGSSSGSDMLGQGKVAMVIEGNWAIPYLQDNFPALQFDTAPVPTLNHRPGTMVFTVAYVMNRRAQHKSEAWQLIAYLTGKAGMAKWTSTGFALPTRRSVAKQLRYDRDPLRSPLVAGVTYATPWQLGPYPTPIMTTFNNQFLSALLGEQPLQKALQRAQDNANMQIQAANGNATQYAPSSFCARKGDSANKVAIKKSIEQ
jgi:multiple sugar transport system substrate-binding protein